MKGDSLISQGRHGLAAEAYDESSKRFKQLDQSELSVWPRLGLIESGSTSGEHTDGDTELNWVVERLLNGNLEGLENPAKLIWRCYLILLEANDSRADDVLKRGQLFVLGQAKKIGDPDSRRSYLENIQEHVQLQQLLSSGQT